MTPLPSPPLFIKVACSWNCPPLLGSPSCYLTVTHRTACIVLLGFQQGSCVYLPLSYSSSGPRLAAALAQGSSPLRTNGLSL